MSAPRSLASLRAGESGRVSRIAVEPEVTRWLGALGIASGTGLTVLRRGSWGGPLHVRSEAGADFALARSLAEDVLLDEGAP